MKAFVTDVQGTVWELPPARKWELEYGIGTPCDSFYLICPWQAAEQSKPKDWVRFHAEHEGRRVFTGVVDECEVSYTLRGCELELSGRGLAALLLDNEALGQDYQLATLEDILRDHVSPYGIETAEKPKLPGVSRFRVDTGSSEWTVLEEFLRAAAGRVPRFDPWGRLVLTDWTDGEPLRIGGELPVTKLCRRDRRYGVLSEILVRDRYSGAVTAVKDNAFCQAGGKARRVLTMPGRAGRGEMYAAGLDQLHRSKKEWLELEVTIPAPFWAMPGQLVRIERPGGVFNGIFRTAGSTVAADETGYWTRLVLRPAEHM